MPLGLRLCCRWPCEHVTRDVAMLFRGLPGSGTQQEQGGGASPTQGWVNPGPGSVASSAARINRPLSFLQDPQKPGPCRTHTGTKPPECSETDAVELPAPGGQRPGTGARCLAAPGAAQSGQGELQCPHCLQGFGDEQGEELLRHVAECCL